MEQNKKARMELDETRNLLIALFNDFYKEINAAKGEQFIEDTIKIQEKIGSIQMSLLYGERMPFGGE